MLKFIGVLGMFLLLATPGFASGDLESRATSIINQKCAMCHSTKRVYRNKGRSKQWWTKNVKRMREYGTQMTDEEARTIVEYLSK
ncbi:c-type cytochrome [Thermodesulfatator atlanticus]|uniref:c-type cytochrome n=1 Tax=Thermodesulfatator atlanticus TaxID=501497 RepID=UPI0003B4C570|nr:c-type cytochrome [Thermodesulfatator atlanticus]